MDAIGQVNQIEPKRCREYVELRFDVPRMADDYLLAYQRILKAEGKWSRSVVGSGLSSKENPQGSHLKPNILEGQPAKNENVQRL